MTTHTTLPLQYTLSFEDYLVHHRLLTPDQLSIAQREQKAYGKSICYHLRALNLIQELALGEALSACCYLPLLDAGETFPPNAPSTLTMQEPFTRSALPWREDNTSLTFAITDPFDVETLQHLITICPPHKQMQLVLTTTGHLTHLLSAHYQHVSPLQRHAFASTDPNQIVDHLIREALAREASDIHFAPDPRWVTIRYRLDGMLQTYTSLHRDIWLQLKNCLKIWANLDIAEARRPQDGRFCFPFRDAHVDCRVSCHPIENDENIVIRLLGQHKQGWTIDSLHFPPDQREKLFRIAHIPEGLILFTGPTGSGKTTTLYGLLATINSPHLHIMTLEDPIEYRLPHARQTQVSPLLNFSDGIRSMLRQDPDVMLIGEIRDAETAKMALQAALTGHKVLSTIHAGTCQSVLTRLHDLTVSPDLVLSTLKAIVNQRLLRQLCQLCKQQISPKDLYSTFASLDLSETEPPPILYEAAGCEHCHGTGYKGRFPVAECLLITPEMSYPFAETSAPQNPLKESLPAESSLWRQALNHVYAGHTSFQEVLRVIPCPAVCP